MFIFWNYSKLTQTEDEIIEKNVKLIIIDSLASVVRRDFPNEYMLERAVSDIFSNHYQKKSD